MDETRNKLQEAFLISFRIKFHLTRIEPETTERNEGEDKSKNCFATAHGTRTDTLNVRTSQLFDTA